MLGKWQQDQREQQRHFSWLELFCFISMGKNKWPTYNPEKHPPYHTNHAHLVTSVLPLPQLSQSYGWSA